jgi:hypothetical protein
LMLQLFSCFFVFGSNPYHLWWTNGLSSCCRRLQFLAQKKKIFLKINSSPSPSPPPFALCHESNNTHMDMCNIHMIILILRKTLFFGHDNRPWQLARKARPMVLGTDKP